MEHIEKLCREYGISPNQLYVLWCINQKRKPIEESRVSLDIRLLQTKGLVEIVDTKSVKLTMLGLNLVDQVQEMFKKRWALKDVTANATFKENVNTYRDIWPKVSIGGGTNKRPLRSSPAEINRAFKNFFNNYPNTTWEDIFKATKNYIHKWGQSDDKTYMKNASSFVYKEKSATISELAKEIEMFDSHDTNDDTPVIIPKSK
jgi:transposase-like protein